MKQVTIEQVIANPALVSLPSVALDVLALTRRPGVKLSDIAAVVQNDQALTAKILKTVNSSFYGLPRPCPTITRALTYLGLSAVKSLVLGFSLIDTARQSDGLDMISHWRRGIYSAAAARRIAVLGQKCDAEEAFTAALMLDIGMPAIHSVLRGEYVKLIEKTGGDHDLLPKIEREALGFDHAEAGAQLAERWRLPSEMVIAIRKHHDDDIPPSTGVLGRIVALGYQAAATLCISPAAAALARFRRNAKDWLGLHEGECDELLAEIASDAAELSKLFQINTGAVSDVRAILAQAEEASLEHQLTVAREAESLRRMNIDLAQQAATDPLTGTGNRARFENDLRANLENAQQCGSSLAVLIIDADYFKRVNDEFGHAAGDEVLVEIGKRLTRQAREIGVVCRWGGEEFAIVLKNVDSRIATRVAEAMRTAMADMPVELRSLGTAGASVNVTVSIGVAVLDERTRHILNTPHLLIQAADRALYEAKSAGRNCVRFANEAAARAA